MGCVFLSHGDCDGSLTDHHIVSRQRLRREWRAAKAEHRRGGPKPWSITKAIADPRDKVRICWGHHQAVEAKRLYVTPPDSAREFAREYGLEWSLEADEVRSSGADEGEAA